MCSVRGWGCGGPAPATRAGGVLQNTIRFIKTVLDIPAPLWFNPLMFFKVSPQLDVPALFAFNFTPRKFGFGFAVSLGKFDLTMGFRTPKQAKAYKALKASF